MGSASHAILVTKQNRALQRTSNKTFLNRNRYAPTSNNKNLIKRYHENGSGKKASINKSSAIYLIGLLIGVAFFIFFVRRELSKPIKTSHTLQGVMKTNVLPQKELVKKLYFSHLKRGNRFYENGKFYLAYQDYKVALRLIPTGLNANYGMGNSLRKLCESRSIYCEESQAYADAMSRWNSSIACLD